MNQAKKIPLKTKKNSSHNMLDKIELSKIATFNAYVQTNKARRNKL